MATTYNAIPTRYADVEFRSRLEARWAAFFDALGWEWEYEPTDLNGWIPDFRLRFHRSRPLWIEVKPEESLGALKACEDELAGQPTEYDILLVGDSPVFPCELHKVMGCSIGRLYDGRFRNAWWQACCNQECPIEPFGPFFGFHYAECPWNDAGCRLCGDILVQQHLTRPRCTRWLNFLDLCWKEAGNVTQWKGRRYGQRINHRELAMLNLLHELSIES
jgi:hypothetical protein